MSASSIQPRMSLIEVKEMSTEYLPNNSHIIGYGLFLKSTNSYHKPLTEFIPNIVKKVQDIWLQIPISIKSPSGIRFKVVDVLTKYQKMIKNTRRSLDEEFLQSFFNVAKCQCIVDQGEDIEEHNLDALWANCNCVNESKIPSNLRQFFIDQLNSKEIKISSLQTDVQDELIRPNNDFNALEETEAESLDHIQEPNTNESGNLNGTEQPEGESDSEFDPNDSSISFDSDGAHGGSVNPMKLITSIRSLNLKEVAIESDRRNLSNRDVAAILNAGLVALGVISKNKRSLVIGPDKVRRERIKARKLLALEEEELPQSNLLCFSFDGKKNETLLRTNTGNHITKKKLENICILKEPQHKFLGFISTADSSASAISNGLLGFFLERNISLEDLIAIQSDGTVTNTGAKGGIIHLIEKELNRPLHWFICLLHLMECILRNVFFHLDGRTSGPSVYSGPIGQELDYCEWAPIAKFKKVTFGEMPDDITNFEFTNDQKLLMQLGKAVNSGRCDEKLSIACIGKVHKARWITTSSRILRLYMSKNRPSLKLRKMVTFIMKVYIPIWLQIKYQPFSTSGSIHFYRIVENCRGPDVAGDVFGVVCETLKNNPFFAHSENVLLAMLVDEDKSKRNRAIETILLCREKVSSAVRKFNVPHINFDCTSYTELVDWTNLDAVWEPPFTQNLSSDQLNAYENSDDIITVPEFPCHSQRTEHCVQAMSNAVKKVAGNKEQINFIKTKMAARQKYSKFNTKKDWNY